MPTVRVCACSVPSNHRNKGSGVLLKNVRSSISTGMLRVNFSGTRETSNSNTTHFFPPVLHAIQRGDADDYFKSRVIEKEIFSC